eukprot:SAG31_NODE_23948_length_492_cov_1.119593_1_plen_37_part_01
MDRACRRRGAARPSHVQNVHDDRAPPGGIDTGAATAL